MKDNIKAFKVKKIFYNQFSKEKINGMFTSRILMLICEGDIEENVPTLTCVWNKLIDWTF